MKPFKTTLLTIAIPLLLFYCKEISAPIEITTDHFHTAIDKVVEVMIHDIFSPPVASRVFVYQNIAAYEILAQNDSTYSSLKNQISHLESIPSPNQNKKINYSLAALIAHIHLSKQLIFSEDKIERHRDSLYNVWEAINPRELQLLVKKF